MVAILVALVLIYFSADNFNGNIYKRSVIQQNPPTRHHVPIRLIAVTGNLRGFYNQRKFMDIKGITGKKLMLDTLEIDQCSVFLKRGNPKITLPTSMTIILIKKTVRNIINTKEHISYIKMLLDVTWQAPQKLYSLDIQKATPFV